MKILSTFDRVITEVLADKVQVKLSFKVRLIEWITGKGEQRTWFGKMGHRLICHSCWIGPSGYLPILRRSLDIPDQGRQFQVGQPEHRFRG